MTEEQIQQILDILHQNEIHKYQSELHTYRNFEPEFGDPWSGYTKNGCEIKYYPETNTYTWEVLCEHSLAGWYLSDPFEITKEILIERLGSMKFEIL
jgi:hypothetical protein